MRARFRPPIGRRAVALPLLIVRKREVGLATPDEFQIDLRQKLAIQKRAVLLSRGVIDHETSAQRVE